MGYQAYDGVRKRVFPKLYKALVPGAPDYRVKGALWQLNTPAFAKYAMTGTDSFLIIKCRVFELMMVSEPALLAPLFKALMSCQVYEKASIQKCVAVIAENCLVHFFEPNYLIYALDSPTMNAAASDLESILPRDLRDNSLVKKGKENREKRIELFKSCLDELVSFYASFLALRAAELHRRGVLLQQSRIRTLIGNTV